MAGIVLLAPLSAAAGGDAVASQAYHVLVGSYGEGIYSFRFDAQSGRIEGPLAVEQAANPSWLTLSADRRHLYAVNEQGRDEPAGVGQVSAYALEPASAALSRLNQVASLGDHPTHSSLSADGRFLFVANYSVAPQGSLAVLPVLADGTLGPVAQIEFNAVAARDGANPKRQASSHVHSAVPSPDGRFLFAADLGHDRVYAYRYQPERAQRPLQAVQPAYAELPTGSGPRHLLFRRDGRFAYLTLELTGQVALLRHRDGVLDVQQTLDLAPAGFKGEQGAGALHLSADERFLYVLNRGDDNHLSVFAVTADDGHLRQIQRVPSQGTQSREFAIAPDGRFLLIANQGSDALVVLPRDPASGLLGKPIQQVNVGAPSDLVFVPNP
ncbi:lactonase family protein [Pseudomonas borbori]